MMTTFLISWIVAALVLIVFAGWIGYEAPTKNVLGILIDARGRFSLTHFQIVLWTIVILSSAIGVLVAKGWNPAGFVIPQPLLGLMGISVGSAVLTTSVKATKDTPGSGARVARDGLTMNSGSGQPKITRMFSQIWLQEEGALADQVIDITKFQNFIFTLVVLGIYIAMAREEQGLPNLPANVVTLIGISHAGYVGGKVPNKK
jgi:hypothetical protein